MKYLVSVILGVVISVSGQQSSTDELIDRISDHGSIGIDRSGRAEIDLIGDEIQLSELLPIANALVRLSIEEGKGRSLSDLVSFRSLNELMLLDQARTNLPPIGSLKLETLFLDCPRVADYQEVGKIRGLRDLRVMAGPVVDFSFLTDLHRLELLIIVGVSDGKYSSLDTIAQLPRLKFLKLIDVPDITKGLDHHFPALREMELVRNIGSLEFLRNHRALRYLSLSGCSDDCDYRRLGMLDELRNLYINPCNFDDLSVLEPLKNLQELSLVKGRVSSLESLHAEKIRQ